uniref:C2H2-type domain-containing protein n=1 Tax=Macrostomum lignano TaxID=282301 RepID=A0A1I8FBL9_9PLAT
ASRARGSRKASTSLPGYRAGAATLSWRADSTAARSWNLRVCRLPAPVHAGLRRLRCCRLQRLQRRPGGAPLWLSGGGDSGCCSCRSSGSSLLREDPALDRISTVLSRCHPSQRCPKTGSQPQQHGITGLVSSDSVDRCALPQAGREPATPASFGRRGLPACPTTKPAKLHGVAPFSHPAITGWFGRRCRCRRSVHRRIDTVRLDKRAGLEIHCGFVCLPLPERQRLPVRHGSSGSLNSSQSALHGIRRRRSCRRAADANATRRSCSNSRQLLRLRRRSRAPQRRPRTFQRRHCFDRSTDDLDDWQARSDLKRQRVELEGGSAGAALLGLRQLLAELEGAERRRKDGAAGKRWLAEREG